MRNSLASLALDRRLWLGTAGRIVAVLLIINIGVAWQHRTLEQERQANLLAPNTDPRIAGMGAPRYDVSIGGNLDQYWKYIPDARVNRVAYLVGMSQMYRINDPRPGDETIAEHLDDMLAPQVRVFGLAAPNLDNEEALFLLLSVLADPKTKPQTFIYALCFDKMRFVDLRPGYMDFLRQHPKVQSAMTHLAGADEAKYPLAATKLGTTLAGLKEQKAEEENSFEHRLRTGVGRYVPLVRLRKELNVVLTYGVLYQARNKLLGIKNTTKRPIIQGRYDLNKQLLQMMIDVAQANGVQLIIYINPLNPQAENPYVTSEYVAFKRWAETTARGARIPFANLEGVVPQDAWGLFMGGPDFKHFAGEGHLRTAEAIAEHFGRAMTDSAGLGR